MRMALAIFFAAACPYGAARAAPSDRLVLPLPSQGKNVSISIGQGIELVAVPDQGNWTISAYRVNDKARARDLLVPNAKWHGPYPEDVEAWQILKHYGFGNTRWVCARGYLLEVKLLIRNA